MLHREPFQEPRLDEGSDQSLSLLDFYEILKRRAFYFVITFGLVSTIGTLIALAWPAKYVSKGTIFVESQQIPSDLVRPTVSTLANQRIQIIEQRIMTRDNLLAIAKKFHLSTGWSGPMSGTEMVNFLRQRIQIKPLEPDLQSQGKQTIVFTVGFEYEQPQIALGVANELVTMILNEDVRARTDYASETTKFLEKEVERLEAQLRLNDTQISELKRRSYVSQLDDGADLAKLKAELLFKSATESDAHPDIIALKRKIEALEKTSAPKDTNATTSENTAGSVNANTPGLDTLQTQRRSIKEELNAATQKLSTARLGESLERGQHAERLEVVEQPTLPEKPISPNRRKLLAFTFLGALIAGSGMVFAAEMLYPAIRRSTDLISLIDSNLIVSIPYISTHSEIRRKKNMIRLSIGTLAVVIVSGLMATFFLLPPPDVLFEKVVKHFLG